MKLILYANIVATFLMTGAILVIQLVHYPLFNRVGADAFRTYESAHTNAITVVVFPLMSIELITALLLAIQPPENVPPLPLWIGLGLVGVIWFMTAFVHVPQHGQLGLNFSDAVYQALISTNWIRTIAWIIRTGLMLYVLDRFFQQA